MKKATKKQRVNFLAKIGVAARQQLNSLSNEQLDELITRFDKDEIFPILVYYGRI